MSNTPPRLSHVPPGVQCFVGDEARRRRLIEERVVAVFEGWDYEEIIPPLYDYAEVFAGKALSLKTYSFVGRDGSVLALRPDFTSLLAKIAAGRLRDRPAPIRLYYSGEVLRYEPPKAGRQSELHQMGLEHLGGDATAADAEVLAIAAECLDRLGAQSWVLAVGHVGVFTGLLAGSGLDPDALERLRERVEGKDAGGVREVLQGSRVGPEAARAVLRLTELAGDASVLGEAARAFEFSPATSAAGEVRGLDYYTGLVFRAYAPGLGFEIGGGGRYDGLLERFGRPMPAVGFMLGLDRLALLLERQGALPVAAAAAAENVSGPVLGEALKNARALRTAGVRVRFGNGGGR